MAGHNRADGGPAPTLDVPRLAADFDHLARALDLTELGWSVESIGAHRDTGETQVVIVTRDARPYTIVNAGPEGFVAYDARREHIDIEQLLALTDGEACDILRDAFDELEAFRSEYGLAGLRTFQTTRLDAEALP